MKLCASYQVDCRQTYTASKAHQHKARSRQTVKKTFIRIKYSDSCPRYFSYIQFSKGKFWFLVELTVMVILPKYLNTNQTQNNEINFNFFDTSFNKRIFRTNEVRERL
jgi:uncharacterized protein YaiL (DUF2058 family)